MNTTEEIVEMARKLFAALVRKSAEVRMNKITASDRTIIYTVSGDPGDVARIVGQGGSHFIAVRKLVEIACANNRQSIVLSKVEEPDERIKQVFTKFKYDPLWPKAEVLDLLKRTVEIVCQSSAEVNGSEAPGGTHCLASVRVAKPDPWKQRSALEPLNKIFSSIGVTHGIGFTVEFSE